MKKIVNGKMVEMTPEEIAAMQKEAARAELSEKTRPLTAEEVNRLFITQNINTVITDDATASRAVEFHPEMQYNGALIQAGTRIRWGDVLKKAASDLWDTKENNPDNAPTLWADLAYRNGIRIIQEVITVTTAFSNGELGWWTDGNIYRSKKDNNVYTPAVRPEDWEAI